MEEFEVFYDLLVVFDFVMISVGVVMFVFFDDWVLFDFVGVVDCVLYEVKCLGCNCVVVV